MNTASLHKGTSLSPFCITPAKIAHAILLVGIFLILESSYKTFVAPYFPYYGFDYEFNIAKYVVAKLFFLGTLLFLTLRHISRFVYSISVLFTVFMLIPNLILYEFMEVPVAIVYACFVLIISLLIFSIFRIYSRVRIPIIKRSQQVIFLIALLAILLFPFFLTYGFNLNLKVLLLKDVYEVRAASSAQSNIFTAYFYSWLAKAALPVTFVTALIYRNKTLAIIAVAMLLYLFLIGAHKTVLVSVFVVIAFYFFKSYDKQISLFLLGLLLLISMAHAITFVTGNILIESLIVRRVLFIPALLNVYYFDFFNENFVYLSHSIFSSFIEYPYELAPPYLIGNEYFNNPEISANNGIISDGFMNFGWWGVAGNIILTVLIIKIFDRQNIGPQFSGIFFIMVFTLNSSALLTSLLTHGILILLFLSIFIMKNSRYQKQEAL